MKKILRVLLITASIPCFLHAGLANNDSPDPNEVSISNFSHTKLYISNVENLVGSYTTIANSSSSNSHAIKGCSGYEDFACDYYLFAGNNASSAKEIGQFTLSFTNIDEDVSTVTWSPDEENMLAEGIAQSDPNNCAHYGPIGEKLTVQFGNGSDNDDGDITCSRTSNGK